MEGYKWSIYRLLQESAKLYRTNFNIFALVCAAVYLPVYIIYQFIPISIPVVLEGNEVQIGNMDEFLVQAYLIMGVFIIFTPLAAAVIAYIVRCYLDGRKIDIYGILDASLMKWPKLALTSLFFLVIVSVSGCLIVLAVYLGIACGFYTNIIATSDTWGFNAIWQSRLMVKGRWWRTFIIFLIVGIAYLLYNQLYSLLLGMLQPIAVIRILLAVISEIPMSYFSVFLALYFFTLPKNQDLANYKTGKP